MHSRHAHDAILLRLCKAAKCLESLIPRTGNPMAYWRSNKSYFPTLAQLALVSTISVCFLLLFMLLREKKETESARLAFQFYNSLYFVLMDVLNIVF